METPTTSSGGGGNSDPNFGQLKSEVFILWGGEVLWSEIPERGALENLDKNLLFTQKPAYVETKNLCLRSVCIFHNVHILQTAWRQMFKISVVKFLWNLLCSIFSSVWSLIYDLLFLFIFLGGGGYVADESYQVNMLQTWF